MKKNIVSLNQTKIDLVVLWVDSNDETWQKKYLTFFPETDFSSSSRYSQNFELVFSIRSIEKNLPWINKIFVVTDSQKPDWLKETDKLKVVYHSDFIPESYLPLFNSEAIETFLHLIPGLEEHFIYINDDMYFSQPLEKDFFYFSDGTPKVRLKKFPKGLENKNLYYKNVCNSIQSFNQTFSTSFSFELSHGADAYLKSSYGICVEKMKDEFEELRTQKKRSHLTSTNYKRCSLHFSLFRGSL